MAHTIEPPKPINYGSTYNGMDLEPSYGQCSQTYNLERYSYYSECKTYTSNASSPHHYFRMNNTCAMADGSFDLTFGVMSNASVTIKLQSGPSNSVSLYLISM